MSEVAIELKKEANDIDPRVLARLGRRDTVSALGCGHDFSLWAVLAEVLLTLQTSRSSYYGPLQKAVRWKI